MNDTGKNIADGFRELRKFCHQVSLLLTTASSMMLDKDWKRTKPNPVFYTSRALSEPEWWLPHEFVLFFKNTSHPTLIPYIAINVGDPDEIRDNNPIAYALLSAGCMVVLAGKKHVSVEHHWWCRWHLYMGGRRKDDGTVCFDEPQKTWSGADLKELSASVQSVTTLAYPLVEITDTDSLRDKIVKPLLQIIEQQTSVARRPPTQSRHEETE